MKARRASASITLVLIGTAALSGCDEETARRDIYRNRFDCQQDWSGASASQCEPVRSGPHTGYFYGPSYRDDGRNSAGTTTLPRQGTSAIGTAHLARNDTSYATPKSAPGSGGGSTARGGFGSSAASHSSGG